MTRTLSQDDIIALRKNGEKVVGQDGKPILSRKPKKPKTTETYLNLIAKELEVTRQSSESMAKSMATLLLNVVNTMRHTTMALNKEKPPQVIEVSRSGRTTIVDVERGETTMIEGIPYSPIKRLKIIEK